MTLDREASAGYLANCMARLFARAIDRRLEPLGLSSGCLPVFFALAGGGSLPQKELARLAAVEQPTMTATLARMQRDGLIERTTDPADRRSVLVSLSGAAIARLSEVERAVDETNAEGLALLSPVEQQQLRVLMGKVIGALGESSRRPRRP